MRVFAGAALWLLACGGTVNSGRLGEGAAGNGTASGGDGGNSAGGNASGGKATGGHSIFVTGGQGGASGGTSGGGTIAAGGTVASAGTAGAAGNATAGAAGSGGETCGRGGCIPDTNLPPVTPPGPVHCGGTVCEAPLACCLSDSRCYDPIESPDACARPAPDDDLWGRPTCASNAQCGPRQFCQMDSGLCQGAGHCNPIGNCGSCFGGSACRVCGCDGNTYPDMQTACLAAANVVSVQGAGCGETIDTDGGRGAGGGAGDSGAPRLVTLCGSSNDCGSGELCCAITGRCFPTSDPDQCRQPPPGTRLPCTSDAQCSTGEYCLGDGCSGPGGCVGMGSQGDCGVTLEPVCGCDAVTYTSAACASVRGVRVAAQGECGTR